MRHLGSEASDAGQCPISLSPTRIRARNQFTVTVTFDDMVIVALAESVPVKVKVYVPAVVAGVVVPLAPTPPPQPIAAEVTTSQSTTSIEIQRRRRAGIPHTKSNASTVISAPAFPKSRPEGPRSWALVDAAVVNTVRTLVAEPPEVNATLVGLRLQVGKLCAPAGESVREQVKLRVPKYVDPAAMVAVAATLDPGATEAGGGMEIAGGAVTVRTTTAEFAGVSLTSPP